MKSQGILGKSEEVGLKSTLGVALMPKVAYYYVSFIIKAQSFVFLWLMLNLHKSHPKNDTVRLFTEIRP